MLDIIESVAVILSVLLTLWALGRNATGRIRPLLDRQITLSKLLKSVVIALAFMGVMAAVVLVGLTIVQLRDTTDELQRFQHRVFDWHRDFDRSQFREYTWERPNGPEEVQMIVVNAGICYLTRVTGNFDGHAETALITKKDGHWVLSGESNANKYVAATATCWVFPPPIPSEGWWWKSLEQ